MTLPMRLESCELHAGADETTILEAEQALGGELPDDYRELLAQSNGLEGFIGPDAYLSLWSAADLASLNTAYAVREFLPGVILFGTDGGDTGYGFRRAKGQVEYVSVPLVGMSPGAVSVLGGTLEDALALLAVQSAS